MSKCRWAGKIFFAPLPTVPICWPRTNAIALGNQFLVEMRVAQAGSVFVLDDDRVAEALGQVDRIDHKTSAHRMHRRLVGIPSVYVDAAVMLHVEGRVIGIV